MNIGYINPEYGTRRNVLACAKPSVNYLRIRPWMSLMDKVFGKLPYMKQLIRKTSTAYCGGFPTDYWKKINLLHMWNRVPVWPSKLPFIVSFEDTVPRDFGVKDFFFDQCIKSLCSNRCKALIAFSECAKSHQLIFNSTHNIEDINSKLTVLLPPQKILITESEIYKKFEKIKKLKLMFVGKAFFRKGGFAIINVLTRMKHKIPLDVTIVGNVDYFDYAASRTVDDSRKALKLMEENKDWLHYYPVMPNEEVLRRLKDVHVGLLPTRDDTFGYSVLEMQAAGVPCITTDIWSLPEINNNAQGWIISLEKNELRQANYFTDEGLSLLENNIEVGLEACFEEIFENLGMLQEKACLSWYSIRDKHDPFQFSNKLYKIYEKALK